ncbi:MAG TPA: hypothetical protein VF892_21920 [Pseudonocardiaceae bacterium]
MTNEELERRIAVLEDRQLTQWFARRVDRDLTEIGVSQYEQTRKLDHIQTTLVEQLRSLAQLVGQVLDRLPEPDQAGD